MKKSKSPPAPPAAESLAPPNKSRTTWRTHAKRALYVCLALKLMMVSQTVLFRKPEYRQPRREYRLEEIYNDETGTFSVMNLDYQKFIIKPKQACTDQTFVILILSAPNNFAKREQFRKQLVGFPEAKLIFKIGKVENKYTQEQLVAEALTHGDIVQSSVMDGYFSLAYKTLSSFVYINRFCSKASFIIKTDDDVIANFAGLFSTLESKYPHGPPPIVECNAVMRNMRPWRHNHTSTIMGKWSFSRSNLMRRVHPDFCPGWLYITTPEVGLAMVQTAKENYEELKDIYNVDDIYVTGYLRERLPWVQLTQYQPGVQGWLWNNVFTNCPFLGIVKNVFYNDIIFKKGCGSIDYIKGGKFFFCAFLEYFILDNLETISPSLTIPSIVRYCTRGHYQGYTPVEEYVK